MQYKYLSNYFYKLQLLFLLCIRCDDLYIFLLYEYL